MVTRGQSFSKKITFRAKVEIAEQEYTNRQQE